MTVESSETVSFRAAVGEAGVDQLVVSEASVAHPVDQGVCPGGTRKGDQAGGHAG